MISLEHSTTAPEASTSARTSQVVKVLKVIGYIGVIASMVASMVYFMSVVNDGSAVAVPRGIAVVVFYASVHVWSKMTVGWYFDRKDRKAWEAREQQ